MHSKHIVTLLKSNEIVCCNVSLSLRARHHSNTGSAKKTFPYISFYYYYEWLVRGYLAVVS